jgi:hypothetical protein
MQSMIPQKHALGLDPRLRDRFSDWIMLQQTAMSAPLAPGDIGPTRLADAAPPGATGAASACSSWPILMADRCALKPRDGAYQTE